MFRLLTHWQCRQRKPHVIVLLSLCLGLPCFADGGLEQAFQQCINPPLASGLPGLGNNDLKTYWLPCAMMVCSQFKAAVGCGWYNELTQTRQPTPGTTFEGEFIADDGLIVQHNGFPVHLGMGIPYGVAHKFNITNVKPGDYIEFIVHNKRGPGRFNGRWTWNGHRFHTLPENFLYASGVTIAPTGVNGYPVARWLWFGPQCENCSRFFVWHVPDYQDVTGFVNADDKVTIYRRQQTGGPWVASYRSPQGWQIPHAFRIAQVKPKEQLRFELTNYQGGGHLQLTFNWNSKTYHSSSFLFRNQGVINLSINPFPGGFPDSYPIWKKEPCTNCIRNFYWTAPQAPDVGDEVAAAVQSLKNFIALQQLEYVRDQVLQQVTPPAMDAQTQFSGFKMHLLQETASHDLNARRWHMLMWDLFTNKDYTPADTIYDHTTNYCSYFEAGFAKTQRYCAKANVPLPYDLLASTLFSQVTLPRKGVEYLYAGADDASKKRYIVTQQQRPAFLKRVPNNRLIRSYANVNQPLAALTYIRNLTNPVPLTTLPDSQLFDNKSKFIFNKHKGIPYIKAQYHMLSLLSLARESLLRAYIDRLPSPPVAKVSPDVSQKQVNASLLGVLDYESNRRFQDAEWQKQMARLPYTALIKEMANMMGLELTQTYRVMSQLERIEAMLAVSGADTIQQTVVQTARAKQNADRQRGQP